MGDNLKVFGPVFSFKLGCFVMSTTARPIQARQSLELKTPPRCCPVRLSLPMLGAISLLTGLLERTQQHNFFPVIGFK
jgi:hypothetical protein